jgi:hypothetical protein
MACLCCGQWRIEIVNLDGRQRYKILRGGYLAESRAYARTPSEVAALLARLGGPDLASFGECD